ncbi:helix-turn-helix domain-containing protein [Neptuniibacter sp.]|uniref:helix-turn-helix domain-containing protein n=1 Tax=Neptuniibacter sp. TaxID=1962643 RepID=UPI0026247B89|nr:helix-turn-helix domain-containing protein [Neptuniibacter sp.]MCP4596139.1 hypothetical protein [Neptuniibacter sp.]
MKLFKVLKNKQPLSPLLKKYTQADLVLALLQQKGTVTTEELKKLGIDAPGAVISKLRTDGFDIETKLVKAKRKNGLVRRRIAEYSLAEYSSSKGGI